MAEKLIRDLGLEFSWARRSDGQLLTSQRVHGTGYIPRGTTNYVEVVQQQGVYLYQKIGDGTLVGGEQGKVLVRFVSDRKVSDVEARLVVEAESISVPAVSKRAVNQAAIQGRIWIAPNLNLGATVEVVGAEVVYPVTGRWQNRLVMPYYRLHVKKPGQTENDFIFTEATSEPFK